MKVTDLRRKLMAALAAGGVLAPGAVYAADLDTQLLANPGFESVNSAGTLGAYNAPIINDWTPDTAVHSGFAYSHNGSLSNGVSVPNYANGSPLATGGNWYFSPNANPDSTPGVDPDTNDQVVNAPELLYQDIDVSTGQTLTLINSGTAKYNVSGYFNTYQDDNDLGHVQLKFLNSSNASLGTAEVVAQGPLNDWVPNSASGLIPAATRTVRVSIYGTTTSDAGPDGYIDNVNFQISSAVRQPVLALAVDRNTGTMTLSNSTSGAVNLKSYQIASAFEGLDPDPAKWKSIADNYDAGSPGLDQVDAAHNWVKLTDPNANGDLSEADLESALGASLAVGRTINLGIAGTWIATPNEDLIFEYVSGTQLVRGMVTYTGNGGQPLPLGDVNASGSITAADWAIVRTNQHTNLSSKSLAEAYRLGDLTGDHLNNHADFVVFKTAYDAANGAGSFVSMLASIPEPSTIFMVLTAGLFALPAVRRPASRE